MKPKILLIGIDEDVKSIINKLKYNIKSYIIAYDFEYTQELREHIKESLKDTDILILTGNITEGMAFSHEGIKHTDKGNLHIDIDGFKKNCYSIVHELAQMAQEFNILTIPVVAKPFRFEPKAQRLMSEIVLETLKQYTNAQITVPSDKIHNLVDKSKNYAEVMDVLHMRIAKTIYALSSISFSQRNNDVYLDYSELKAILSLKGMALMGFSESSLDIPIEEAMILALESPTMDNMSVVGAKGIFVHFTVAPNYSTSHLTDAMEVLYEYINEEKEIDIVFNSATDESFQAEQVSIVVIATGFEVDESVVGINNMTYIGQ